MTYFWVFLQSNLLELPAYLWFWKYWAKRDWREGALLMTSMNAVTHPLVFFVLLSLPLSFLRGILLSESIAIGSEAVFLLWLTGARPLVCLGVSALANFLSWQLAPALTYLILK